MTAFTVEDLARTALVRILPRSRYRLAAQSDSRFQSFAANTSRIAYRQQGATPAFLLFAGPGQDVRSAALEAAAWAQANWRPTAVQRTVRPGVVVVQVAPAQQLATAGPVAGAAVPAAVWTVDSETGRVEAPGSPPGSPPAGEVRHAATMLAQGGPAPSLGELDLAERAVMQVRTVAMPRVLTGVIGILLFLFVLRYGLGGIFSLFVLPSLFNGSLASAPGATRLYVAGLVINVLLLVGTALGVAVYFNFRNLAFRLPGFSSPVNRTRNLAWGGYVAIMVALAIAVDGALPAAERGALAGGQSGELMHVTANANDDGSETYVLSGGDLTVDLTDWPAAEWPGVQFKTSNPSVLTVDSVSSSGPPVAHLGAHQVGAARVDASSTDGRYSFQLRVNVVSS